MTRTSIASSEHPPEQPRDWIFTFGYGQWDWKYRNHFVRIHGTFAGARAEMMSLFGTQWSMQHASEDDAGVDQFHLIELILKYS